MVKRNGIFSRSAFPALLLILLTQHVLAQNVDDGFDPDADSSVEALVMLPDGNLLAGGFFTNIGGLSRPLMAKISTDGSVDTGFNANLNGDAVRAVALQTDGRIVAAGTFSDAGFLLRENIARFHPDGSIDTGFNPGANDHVYSLALQSDGKILVGGASAVRPDPHRRAGHGRHRVRSGAGACIESGRGRAMIRHGRQHSKNIVNPSRFPGRLDSRAMR